MERNRLFWIAQGIILVLIIFDGYFIGLLMGFFGGADAGFVAVLALPLFFKALALALIFGFAFLNRKVLGIILIVISVPVILYTGLIGITSLFRPGQYSLTQFATAIFFFILYFGYGALHLIAGILLVKSADKSIQTTNA